MSLFGVACGGANADASGASTTSGGQVQAAGAGDVDARLHAAVAGPARLDAEKARDKYRHPIETLEFLGLKPSMTVIELSPGAGWFSAILAPTLKGSGTYIAAGGDPNGPADAEGTKNAKALLDRWKSHPDAFGEAKNVVFGKANGFALGAPESADMVLTFRNLHNWIGGGTVDEVLKSVHDVLKPGGVFGVEDHRANAGAPSDAKTVGDTGYVPEAFAIKTIEAAGFRLDSKSEVNANPSDTKDYPKGVWTLPPTYALGDTDHAKYEAIGESDRMTLRFVRK